MLAGTKTSSNEATGLAPGAQRAPTLALIVPTLNEEGNIARLIDRARAALDERGIPFEIIVVDDDSRDLTSAVVVNISEQDPRVHLVVRKGQRGLSGAILDGWLRTNADILGVIDADLQHPPELLPHLYDAVASGRDLAIGSRYTPGGGIGDWSALRKLLSSAAVWATWPLQKRGARAHDPMSGLFMVRRNCVENIPFQRSGFKLLLDILIRSRIRSVQEVPFEFGLRTEGESKANLKVGWDYAKLLIRLYARKVGLGRNEGPAISLHS
jgi:dolichol-phosphate mannosyltransferase